MSPRRPWRYRPATNRNRRAIEDPAGRSATQHRCRATLPYHAVRAGCNPLVMASWHGGHGGSFVPAATAPRCVSVPFRSSPPRKEPPGRSYERRGPRGRGSRRSRRCRRFSPAPRRDSLRTVNWRLASSHLPSSGGASGWQREVAAGGGEYADPRGAVAHPSPIPDVSASATMLHCAHRAGGRLAAHHAGVASRIPQLQYVALGAATWGSDQPAPQR